MNKPDKSNEPSGVGDDKSWLEILAGAVGSLRFGVDQIVAHDSRVVQIERTERVRLSGPPGAE